MTSAYGIDPETGELTICRAKPENRGKGRCYHTSHPDVSFMTQDDIHEFNERKLAQYYKKNDGEKHVRKVNNPFSAVTLTEEEFNHSVSGISQAFPQEAYDYIKQITTNVHRRLSDNQLNKIFDSTAENIQDYLESSDPIARQTRLYLGKDISLKDFSELIAFNVSSMTRSEKWRANNRRNPGINRVVMTSIANDMTKERYIASMLFFGGRCCYCGQPVAKTKGPRQATGEHITPVSPKTPPPGATRFGNMALACAACNKNRSNEQLETWVVKTSRIKPENKKQVLSRIQQFRNFALYKDFTKKEAEEITLAIDHLHHIKSANVEQGGGWREGGKERMETAVLKALDELREKIR